MNKYKLYMIFGIVLLGLSITGSLAYYVWSSSTTSISGNLCLPEIYFTGGATINSKLKPVSSKEEGLIKEIEVNLHKTCNNDTAVMNLYLSLDLLPTALQENTFVYELYNGSNELITSGNFSDKKQGDTIALAENEIVTSNVSIYTLYIYIDGNRDNPITMTNQNFRFNIYGKGTGAIYKENVIQNETTTPSSSSSTFLNTEVLRNQIESITIEKTNVVPNDAKYSKDISSKQDGSVMLWYTDKDNNSLYEVSIGSENGSVEANTNGSGMFAYLDNVSTLDLSGLDTSNMTSMSRMFYKSTSLQSIDVSGFDTSKVVNMSYMFEGCSNLEILDLSNFKTSNVSLMQGMFWDCQKLKNIDVSNFNTGKVTSMNRMFWNCKSLIEIDLSNFNTSNVTDMYALFQKCEKLIFINIENFKTSKVTTMGSMFQGCTNIEKLDLSNFDTSSLIDMNSMFRGCSKLTTLDLSNFDTSNVTSMSNLFSGLQLTTLDLSSFNTSKVTSMVSMFSECTNLIDLDLSNFNTSKVTDMSSMFWNNKSLKTIYVSDKWNTSNVTNSNDMFFNDYSLTGAVPFDSSKTDISMANYTTGYLTYKSNN
ncbi:MAG: BspA family leucine-rich repeat surface protein [Candidatus Gastranaerophilaceae bacterium]